MKKTLTVRLDSRFYNQLESVSAKKGVSKSFLVREALEGSLSSSHEEVDAVLLKSMTTALKENKSVSFKTNWQQIERELSESSLKWPSADKAMKHIRGRK